VNDTKSVILRTPFPMNYKSLGKLVDKALGRNNLFQLSEFFGKLETKRRTVDKYNIICIILYVSLLINMIYLFWRSQLKANDKLKNKNLSTRSSIPEKVIDEIREALLRGNLKPGDRLPTESQLASKFSVSRIGVREAMKMLSVMGVVEINRGDGTYIAKNISASIIDPLIFSLIPGEKVPEELLDLREMLEIGMLEIVLKRATKDDIRKMEEAIELLEKDSKRAEKDSEILNKHNLAFHYAFAQATHNPMIIKIAEALWGMFAFTIKKSTLKRTKESVKHHTMILEALKEKNSEKARMAIRISLKGWQKYGVREVLGK